MDEFPDMEGFSVRNLKYVRQWYLFYCSDLQKESPAIGQQLVAQLENESRQYAGKFEKQDISQIELKTVKFKPEFAGKLNFYISAVDGILKTENDNPSIGILICKSKNDTVEYALKDIHKPIGVSEYIITKSLPKEFRSSLPSIEEIEAVEGRKR